MAVDEGAGDERASPPGVRRNPARRPLWALAAAIATGAVVFSGIYSRTKSEAALNEETLTLAVPSVSILHPRRSEPRQEIVLPANIQAYSDAPIYARTNGYLKKWYADIGARVSKGQLLAEIDTPEVDQQLRQARAELATAQANERLAQITAKRYQDLMSSDAVSQQDVDNAVGNLASTRAQAQSAEENVKRLEDLQSFEKIYAPFAGVITARNVDVGNLIDSGGAGGPQKEMFHIAAIHELRVYVNVPQIYSPSARPGMAAYLTLPQFPGKRFAGKLVRTANAIDPSSRTLMAEVDVDNESGALLPGAYAEVHLAVPTSAATVILPVNTLIFRDGGMQVATVNDGKRVHLTPIVLGRDFGTEVEVVSGVGETDAVIVNPPDSLVAGEEVRVVNTSGGGAGR